MRVGAAVDHAALAAELHAARIERREVDRLTDRFDLSIEDAYRIQAEGIRLREAEGETVVGGKLGFTSEAMRRAMGVDEPNHGWLTDAMLLQDGVVRLDRLIHPKAEPEIGFVVGQDLGECADAAAVLAATTRVAACVEVVDSRFRHFAFRAADNIADDSSAAAFVVGDRVAAGDLELADLAVSYRVDGHEVAAATGAAVMGHPAEAVARMARATAGGRGLRGGDVVLSGGLTAPVTLEAGMRVTVVIEGIGSATLEVR